MDFQALKLWKSRSGSSEFFDWPNIRTKETTLERADFTFQLSMFVTAEKERQMFIIFFLSSFCQLLSPRFQAMAGWVCADRESSHQPA